MRNGFTLIELLVTVSVIAIVLSIGVPSFQYIIRQNKFAAQTNGFLAVMNHARSAAVTSGKPVSLCPRNTTSDGCSSNWNNGVISFFDTNANGVLDTGDVILRVSDNNSSGGTTMTAVQQGTSTAVGMVGYLASGGSTSNVAITFTLCDPTLHQSRILTFSLIGHISISQSRC